MSTRNQYPSKSLTYPEWAEIFPYWDKKTVGYQFILDKILETVGDPKGKSFLDVGCGYGYFDFVLAEMGANTTALDVRPKEIKKIREMKEKYKVDNLQIIHSELKKWYAENDKKVDYTLWLNVMHHIGLFDGREHAFKILDQMLDNSKAVFVMVRPYWTRSVGTWDIGRTFPAGKETIIRETGAHLVDFGAVPHWQAGRPLYVLTR